MADTGVKIRLSADTSQLKKDIKQALGDELGGSIPKDGSTRSANTQKSADEAESTKTISDLYKELSLVRKELQKFNRGKSSNSNSHDGSTPDSSNKKDSVPKSGKGKKSKSDSSGGSDAAKALGKLASAAAALGVATKVIGSLKSAATSSQSGMSLAYQTYGSTLAYTDYNQARKESSQLGSPYGYNYETVMNAGSANMAKAGFTSLENYKVDMTSLFSTSKAWGIDASSLASTSGYMSSIGVTKSGDQKQFANMLSESIVEAEMTGREDEQLQVLESIAENLASVNSTVSEDTLVSGLNMYNALVSNNENLKGTRGAEYTTTMQDLATSGDSTLDILAGYGTEYTGLEGKLSLRSLAEENPDEYWKRVYQGVKQYGLSDDQFTYMMYKKTGSVSKANEIINGAETLTTGETDIDTSYQAGKDAVADRNYNYNNNKVSTLEKYDVSKQETKDDIGGAANNIKSLFAGWYNGLSGGQKTVFDTATTVGGAVGGYKIFNWGINKVVGDSGLSGVGETLANAAKGTKFEKLFSKFAKAAEDTAETVGKAGESIVNSSDDIAKGVAEAAAGSADDAASAASKVASGASKASKGASTLSKVTKWAPIVATGIEAVSTGIDTYQAVKKGDNRQAAKEVGEGVGSIAGGLGGAAAGAAAGGAIGAAFGGVGAIPGAAIGGIIGAIGGVAGGIGGGKLGGAIGTGIYDLATGDTVYTDEQYEQIQEYYNEVQRLYKEKGNNAAQKYTNSVVTPYLNSIGVSQSITDAYKWDVGKPDFMKDWESGKFGNSTETEKTTSDNTDALEENTQALEDILNSDVFNITDNGTYSSSYGKSNLEDLNITGSNSKSTGSIFKLFNSHATGNDYVPYDNYPALLHKGEQVLTKFDADDYRQGKTSRGSSGSQTIDLNFNITGSIDGMTADNQSKIVSAIMAQINQANLTSMLSNGFQRVQNY